jgi:hypothetical protein
MIRLPVVAVMFAIGCVSSYTIGERTIARSRPARADARTAAVHRAIGLRVRGASRRVQVSN